ncbi:MAG: ATP-binding protein [Planctomycetota bacterium]|nr:ATP-binding protein [Planctomycetota bacterium]
MVALLWVLTLTLGVTCWVWASQVRNRVNDIMGEQARQIASTLALAAEPSMDLGDGSRLRAFMMGTRNIVFIALFNAEGKNTGIAYRDPHYSSDVPVLHRPDVESLTQVRRGKLRVLGEFLEVCAPVMRWNKISPRAANAPGSHLVGYVAVAVSTDEEQQQISGLKSMAVGIGCVMVLLSLPLAYLLVHRIFSPIRQLVHATNCIAAGDLEMQVDGSRADAIGELARAFNEMVHTVKRQQDDLHEANHQLEEANFDLERKVNQRTAQLEMANKRLKSEIAEKEDFLRAVSHDLSAPLRNISGMATMLLMKHREHFDQEIIHRLERIQKNVEAETDLISELLDLSRIKTRRQKMEMVEIGPLVRDLEDIFESDLKGRQILLKIDTPMPILNGEKARFRQVFQNLIDNAIKYMGEGPLREIHVGCHIRATEAEFYIRDTGVGIDPDDIEKVFFIFRRGKNPATKNIVGKGVGLASVKSIIETYSGTIWVESTLGQGSTFHFTINGQYVALVPALARTSEQSTGLS